jgi:hypothetical protein
MSSVSLSSFPRIHMLLSLFSFAAYSSALKMDAVGSSEILAPIYQITQRLIPEDSV